MRPKNIAVVGAIVGSIACLVYASYATKTVGLTVTSRHWERQVEIGKQTIEVKLNPGTDQLPITAKQSWQTIHTYQASGADNEPRWPDMPPLKEQEERRDYERYWIEFATEAEGKPYKIDVDLNGYNRLQRGTTVTGYTNHFNELLGLK